MLEQLLALLESIDRDAGDEDVASKKLRTITTLGNVCWVLGNERRKNEDTGKAKSFYERAAEYFKEPAKRDKWAMFGYAEALHALGEKGAEKLYSDSIRGQAIDEYINREEPRTKVLARTTELICCLRVPAFRGEVAAIQSQVVEALGRVDQRLTVFSQLQRRNVTKQEFRQDLEELMRELPPLAPAAAA